MKNVSVRRREKTRWARSWPLAAALAVLLPAAVANAGEPAAPKHLVAEAIDSGFALSRDTYNGIACASDGKIYYVLCSKSLDVGGQMFSYDPATGKVRHLGDLTEASGEKGLKAVPQGKSHANFVESNGKLYLATHVDYYQLQNGTEVLGTPPPGYRPYPGGHFLSYDMKTGAFENLASAPSGQGILAMEMDTKRQRIYGISWPSGYFLRYDLATKNLRNLGKISRDGEGGHGPTFRVLCRSLALDPDDGAVYFTTFEGTIWRYRPGPDAIEKVTGDTMKKDYFGCYDPPSTGTMGYNWRKIVWYPPERAFYGVHGNSGYLFRFLPGAERIDVLQRITSLPSQRSGMYDQFWYGYLGFALGPDGHTLYYLTGAPIYRNGRRVDDHDPSKIGARGEENLHLITYDIPTGAYADHGAIFYADGSRPTYVNSIALGKDGTVYTLARVTGKAGMRTDLIRIAVR